MDIKQKSTASRQGEDSWHKSVRFLEILLTLMMPAALRAQHEKRIVVVTASYNNSQWYRSNLDSIFMQYYDNWHLIYICDAPGKGRQSDGTPELVEQYIKQRGMQHKVTLIRNTEQRGALANQYDAIHSCSSTDIIAVLDGDDFLATPYAFQRVNKEYQYKHVWLTYGQLREWPEGGPGCKELPDSMVKRNAFRSEINWPYFPSHLRTFYAGLFKKIQKEDLMYNGNFMMMSSDFAIMVPMLEMARDRISFIPDILVIYNMANPINDCKVSQQLQEQLIAYIRGRPRYPQLFYPF